MGATRAPEWHCPDCGKPMSRCTCQRQGTVTVAQLQELEWLVNVDAAGQYADSQQQAYLLGYEDGLAHEVDIMRAGDDDAYWSGYLKATQDERRQADEDYADMEPARMSWERPA